MKRYKSNKYEDHCNIFNCDKKHGNLCCRFCEDIDECNNPCLNDIEKCRAYTKLQLTEY